MTLEALTTAEECWETLASPLALYPLSASLSLSVFFLSNALFTPIFFFIPSLPLSLCFPRLSFAPSPRHGVYLFFLSYELEQHLKRLTLPLSFSFLPGKPQGNANVLTPPIQRDTL